MLALVALSLAGCAKTPATPEAAVPVVRAFLQARQQGDSGALYTFLTPEAQKATTRSDVADYIRREQFTYGRIGAPVVRDAGWLQVPIADLSVTRPDGQTRWPEALLTLHHDGRRWGVAWIEPLAAAALSAYQNNRFGDELNLAHTIRALDPYHYRGALEYHYAYRGLKRLREAETALVEGGRLATPSQQADVADAWARFKLELNHPEDAIPQARAALQKAAPYTPFLYSNRWQADVLVVLGKALLARGDRAGAADAAARAGELDPENGSLAMFRWELARLPSPPAPPARY
jgi:tetratricopeptide (TPR) repeat protein